MEIEARDPIERVNSTVNLKGSREYPVKYVTDSDPAAMPTHTLLAVNTHSPCGSSVIVPNAAVIYQQCSPCGGEVTLSNYSVNESPLTSELSPPSSTTSNGATSPMPCMICGDRATGKHYGAHSCDGCKGFFRRSVRKAYRYSCRFDRMCIVDKDKRNQCRYCRFKKCFQAGMRKEEFREITWCKLYFERALNSPAVQNERDKICQHRTSLDDPTNSDSISIKDLLIVGYGTDVTGAPKPADTFVQSKALATVNDVCSSMKQQIIILVEWVKRIPAFVKLKLDDQIALLRGHTAEQLILGAAWRSMPYDNLIILGNECIITRSPKNSPIIKIGCRIMDEIVSQFRDINMDATEYVCMKALVFFDPTGVKGLSDIEAIKELRLKILHMLEDYVNERHLDCRGRFGRLLLILPVLGHVSWKMIETIQIEEVIGNAMLDSLLKEMLLGDTRDSDESEPLTPLPDETNAREHYSTQDRLQMSPVDIMQMQQINISVNSNLQFTRDSSSPPSEQYDQDILEKEKLLSHGPRLHYSKHLFKQEIIDSNTDVP